MRVALAYVRTLVVVLVLCLAVPLGGACGDDDDPSGGTASGSGGSGTSTVICTITVKALALVIEKLKVGEDAAEILSVLEPATVQMCETAIEHLTSSQQTPIPLRIETSNGIIERLVTSQQLLARPTTTTTVAPLPPGALDRIIDCVQSYDSKFLVDLCVDHVIEPAS